MYIKNILTITSSSGDDHGWDDDLNANEKTGKVQPMARAERVANSILPAYYRALLQKPANGDRLYHRPAVRIDSSPGASNRPEEREFP